ncbi:MAG: TolC family protein [Verrucomicrobiota bacterium]
MLCFINNRILLSKLVFIITGGFSFILSGCQSFEPKPLTPNGYVEEWEAYRVDSEVVRDFAARLSDADPKTIRFDVSDGLELEEGEVVSLVFNPKLRVARLKAGVAEATSANAGIWEDPKLNIDVLRLTESIPNPWILGSALSFTVPISGRLEVERDRAEAEHEEALLAVVESEWDVGFDLRQAWVHWSSQLLELEATKKSVRVLEAIIKSQTALLESGEVFETEAALFTIEEVSRRAEIARLKGEVAQGEQKIRILLGLSPSAVVSLIPRMALTGNKNPNSFIENNPTLARLEAAYKVAELTLQQEIRQQYPDLALGPQFESDEGESGWGAVGGIRLPLLNRNREGIAKARAEREVARAAYEGEIERLTHQLATLRSKQKAIFEQRRLIHKQLVPMVDHQLSRAQRLIELGEGSATVLMDSVLRAHEAKLRLIRLQVEESQINNEIRYIQGPHRGSN